MLPFLAMQKVKLVCPHCGAEDTKLATAVKRGLEVTCPACGKKHRVDKVERVIGTSGGRAR